MYLRLLPSVLLSASLVSCAPYDYNAQQDKKPIMIGSNPIYTVDDKGNLRRDRRMENVRSRGCVDNSTDCGRPIGW